MLILIAGHVLENVFAAAFGMSHLAEYTAVRGRNALDRPQGSVRIVADIHGRLTLRIDVLRRDLSVCRKLQIGRAPSELQSPQ